MKPLLHLAHILLLSFNLASSDHLPPLEQVVSEHIVAIETVTVSELRGSVQVYFVAKVQGQTRYVDYRWFDGLAPPLEYVGGEWRMEWYDEQDHCFRAVYADKWLVTHCAETEHTPKSRLDEESNNGWWIPSGLAQPSGRWW